MMGCVLAVDHIRKMTEMAKANSIPPKVVMTAEEAATLRANDPTGYEWQVGEEYYELRLPEKTMGVQA